MIMALKGWLPNDSVDCEIGFYDPCISIHCCKILIHSGDVVAQSVERVTPGEEVLGWIFYWLGRCQYNVTAWDRSHGLPTLSHVLQHITLSDVSLGTLRDIAWLLTRTVRNETNILIHSDFIRLFLYSAWPGRWAGEPTRDYPAPWSRPGHQQPEHFTAATRRPQVSHCTLPRFPHVFSMFHVTISFNWVWCCTLVLGVVRMNQRSHATHRKVPPNLSKTVTKESF